MASTPKRAGRTARPGSKFLSEAVADNVRAYRRRKDLTQDQLATRMNAFGHGWVRATVSEVERRGRAVTIDELGGLSLTLGVEIVDLLDPTGPDAQPWAIDFGGDSSLADVWAGVAHLWARGRAGLQVEWDGDRPVAIISDVVHEGDDLEAAVRFIGKRPEGQS